jgi:hypothetical protein
MAKDAGGHGSEKRGGGMSSLGKLLLNNQRAVSRSRIRANALTAKAAADKAEGRTPLGDYHAQQVQAAAKFNAAHPEAAYTPPNWSAADKAAANKLAEGGAPGKNAPVPVHSAQGSSRGRFGSIWVSRLKGSGNG